MSINILTYEKYQATCYTCGWASPEMWTDWSDACEDGRAHVCEKVTS